MNYLDHIEKITHPQPTASIIWLHGFGADATDFLSIVPLFSAEAGFKLRFIFPYAPLRTVPHYPTLIRSWFDINNFLQPTDFNQAHVDTICEYLQLFIEKEKMQGIPEEKIFLGGFSQGGMQALFCGLSRTQQIGGIIALSTVLPPTPTLTQALAQKAQKPAIFLAHGYHDEVISFSLGEMTKRFLISNDCEVTWKAYEMGHQVSLEELNDIKQWLYSKVK